MADLLLKSVHITVILVLFALLIAEHLLIKPQMMGSELKRLAKIDLLYGIFAGLALILGLSLLFHGGKPLAFYTKNPVFHLKMTIFVIIGLVSIYPTVFYIKQPKNHEKMIEVPKKIVMAIRLQILLFLFMPCLAVLMANGYHL